MLDFPRMPRLVLALLLLLAGPARAGELLVHAAASLSDALGEVAAAHERATGTIVRLNLAGSNALARQIVEGAPGDLFFSADETRMDQVERAGLLVPGTRVRLLGNSLVVVVAEDSPLRPASSRDLARAEFRSIALADPASVPAGIYAREHLEKVGAWDAVRSKVVPAENVRAALAAVEAGNADAAIVYATDARVATGARVAVIIPAAETPEIRHPVAILAGSEHPAEARAFLAFLRSDAAAEIFKRYGYAWIGPPSSG